MITIFLLVIWKKHQFVQLVTIHHHYLPLSLSFLTCYEIKKSAGLILTVHILIERMDLQSCHYTSFKLY